MYLCLYLSVSISSLMNTKENNQFNTLSIRFVSIVLFVCVCFERVNVLGFCLFPCNSSNNNSINYYALPAKRFELFILNNFLLQLSAT